MGLTKLKQIRTDRGLTLDDIAKKCNTSRGHLSNIESNKRDCTVEMAKRIAQVLKCSIDELV